APAADRHDAAGARPARDPVAGQREPVQRRVPGGRPAPRGERPAAVAGVVRGRRSGRRVARRLRVGLRRADRRLLRPVRVLQDRLPPLAFGPPYERRRARSAYVPRRRGGERMNARPIRWSAILSAGALIVASCGGTSVGPSASPTVAKDVNKLFAGLNDSNVAIIDLTSLTVIAKVNTGGKGRADELDYDPKDKKVYVANSGD